MDALVRRELPAAALYAPGGPLSAEAVAALRASPRFPDALRATAGGLVRLYSGNRLLNQLLNDRGRALVGYLALYLHYSRRPDEIHSGLTASRLISLCVDTGVCSRGRAKAMLVLLHVAGYVAAAPAVADRRLRLLEPTGRLIAEHQRRWANQFEAIALVKPEASEILAALDRPDFAPALMCRLGDYYRQGVRVTAYSPELSVFSERDSGLMVLCNLIASSRPDAPLSAPVPISISDLARRFGAARSHIRKLLQEAAREGFVERSPREDQVVMLPRLIDAAENFFATTFLHLDHCARLALDEIGQGPAAG